VSSPKRRPGRLWLLFYGKQRRGFPRLLLGVLLVAVLLGLTFASREGIAISNGFGLFFLLLIAVLAFGALAVAIVAALRPPRGR